MLNPSDNEGIDFSHSMDPKTGPIEQNPMQITASKRFNKKLIILSSLLILLLLIQLILFMYGNKSIERTVAPIPIEGIQILPNNK